MSKFPLPTPHRFSTLTASSCRDNSTCDRRDTSPVDHISLEWHLPILGHAFLFSYVSLLFLHLSERPLSLSFVLHFLPSHRTRDNTGPPSDPVPAVASNVHISLHCPMTMTEHSRDCRRQKPPSNFLSSFSPCPLLACSVLVCIYSPSPCPWQEEANQTIVCHSFPPHPLVWLSLHILLWPRYDPSARPQFFRNASLSSPPSLRVFAFPSGSRMGLGLWTSPELTQTQRGLSISVMVQYHIAQYHSDTSIHEILE